VSATAILIVGVGVILALPLALRVHARRFDPFEPIVIFALAWGVMFVVRPAAILIRGDTDFYKVDIGPMLDRAVLLGLLAAVAFVLGYEARLGSRVAERLRVPGDVFDSSAVLLGAFITAALGLLALALVLLPADGLHGIHIFLAGRSTELNNLIEHSTSYLWYGSLLVIPAALAAFAVAISERTVVGVASAVVLTAVALLRTVPTGNRIFILVLLGGMLVFVFLHLRRRPGVAALSVALAFALVLSYGFLTFRDPETRTGPGAIAEGIVRTPGNVLGPLVKGPDAEMAPALAGALLAVPSKLGYRFGAVTVGDFFLRPIPRDLWPGKPQTPWLEVTGRVWPSARTTGDFEPAFTPVFSFYWDFGLFGVFVGMALIGLGARAAYEYLNRHPANLVVQVLFASALCFFVVVLRHDPVSVTVWGIVIFVPIVAIFSAAGKRVRSLPVG
jgi:hypothetical protein